MDKYPGGQTQMPASHKHRRLVWVVPAVAIFIGAFVTLGYLHRPVIGTVTAVNSTSITIKPSGSTTTKTYSITSTTLMGLPKSSGITVVEARPQKFNAKDIHIGETVAINVNTSNNQVQAITVNP